MAAERLTIPHPGKKRRTKVALAGLLAGLALSGPVFADEPEKADEDRLVGLLAKSEGAYLEKAEKALEVRYRFALSGASLAKASFIATFDGDNYTLLSSAETGGILQKFASSKLRVGSKGVLDGRELRPELYNAELQDRDRRQLVRLPYRQGAPGTPEAAPPYDLERYPVSEAQKQKTVDPIAAIFAIAMGQGASKDAPCGGTVRVFDGKRRYDINLKYLETQDITVGRDAVYKGPALRCELKHVEIAGFKEKDNDPKDWPAWNIWLAPIDDGTFQIPVKLVAHTPFGIGVATAYKLHVKQ